MSINGEKIPGEQETVTSELRKQQALRKIGRARSRLMVCFYTLPLYAIALIFLLNGRRDITVFMFVYMALYAVFAIDMVVKQCPECSKQFFVKSYFLNFFTRKCVHCGVYCQGSNGSNDGKQGVKF